MAIDSAFITQWSTEVYQLAQQKESKLRSLVNSVTGVTGDTYKFHRIGSVTANSKTRDGALTFLNSSHDVKTATLVDKYAAITIDHLDELKSNASLRKEKQMQAVYAINRAIDEAIVDAALAASNLNVTTTTAGGFTFAKLLEAKEELDALDIADEDRVVVYSAAAMTDLLSETKIGSVDYMAGKALVSGQLDTHLGFKFVRVSNDVLPTLGSPAYRQCFVFQKNGVGLAFGQDVKTRIDWSPDRSAWVVNTSASFGAIRIDDEAVIEVPVYE